MKKLLYLFLFIPTLCNSQVDYKKELITADSLIRSQEFEKGLLKLKEIKSELSNTDSLYMHTLGYKIELITFLESGYRMNQDFERSLMYGVEALELIREGKEMFDKDFLKREPYMIKNIIVSNFGLKKYGAAEEYKRLLYNMHKENVLPEGINEYFNFDYFKWEDKNIWGYEWYAELPEDRFSSSFTKVVYYIYSTNSDGSDKEQLYRLHVLMFHANNANFDYVMTKYLDTAKDEFSGTLYAYTYKEKIDFEKLHNDVIRVLEGKAQSDLEMILNSKTK